MIFSFVSAPGGHGYSRSSTGVSLHELKAKIQRLYDLKFGE